MPPYRTIPSNEEPNITKYCQSLSFYGIIAMQALHRLA
jgi:hypothetical protein